MLKKTAIVLIGITVLFGSIYFINKNEGSQVESVSMSSKHEGFSSLEELEQDSEIIIIGKKESSENFVDKVSEGPEKGTINIFYTLSDVKVSKVLKNTTDKEINKSLTVLERGAFDTNVLGKKQYIHVEGYELMKENKKYLLFLRESESDPSQYIIKGVYYGKIPLETNDFEMSEDGKVKMIFKDIAESARKKYKD
jgi:hypothetical protein